MAVSVVPPVLAALTSVMLWSAAGARQFENRIAACGNGRHLAGSEERALPRCWFVGAEECAARIGRSRQLLVRALRWRRRCGLIVVVASFPFGIGHSAHLHMSRTGTVGVPPHHPWQLPKSCPFHEHTTASAQALIQAAFAIISPIRRLRDLAQRPPLA